MSILARQRIQQVADLALTLSLALSAFLLFCACAFTGKAGAVCVDLSLIRGDEVIEEVLQNIC